MWNSRGLMICILLSLSLAACASLEKTAAKNKSLPATDCLEKTAPLSEMIQNLQEKSMDLENRNSELEAMKASLQQKNNGLDFELKKRDAVILSQENVIKLLDDEGKTIEAGLEDEIRTRVRALEKERRKIRYVFLVKDLFIPKTFSLSEKGKKSLLDLATDLKTHENQPLSIEGHTDNIPASGEWAKTFPSNWEISVVRAAAVVRFLEKTAGISSIRMSVAGFGDSKPLESNQTPAGRMKNRRVEIILGPPY